jgi:AbrB family looped-hinge helix DNA binding protein
MSVATATLSSKYQISIPKEIREAMHFEPGQQLAFLRVGKSLRLVPVRKMEDFFGMVEGGEEFVRDRSTHREDSLPVLDEAQKALLAKNLRAMTQTPKSATAKPAKE